MLDGRVNVLAQLAVRAEFDGVADDEGDLAGAVRAVAVLLDALADVAVKAVNGVGKRRFHSSLGRERVRLGVGRVNQRVNKGVLLDKGADFDVGLEGEKGLVVLEAAVVANEVEALCDLACVINWKSVLKVC